MEIKTLFLQKTPDILTPLLKKMIYVNKCSPLFLHWLYNYCS